jgi:hypothetical protein
MKRSTAVVASAAAAAVGVSALGYRAWDRGVFAGATGPAYAPWDEWRGTDRDESRQPLRSAILAASPHNTQPRRFEVSDDAITLGAVGLHTSGLSSRTAASCARSSARRCQVDSSGRQTGRALRRLYGASRCSSTWT